MLENKRNRSVKYINEFDKRSSFEHDLFNQVYLFNEDDFFGKKYQLKSIEQKEKKESNNYNQDIIYS